MAKISIINGTQLDKKNQTYLLYGTPGLGKTTTLKFLTNKKILLLDADKTSHVLKGCKHVDIVDIPASGTWEYWFNLMDELKKIIQQYDVIAIDNLSELERMLLSDLGRQGKNKGTPAMGDYQHVQFLIPLTIRKLKEFNKTIILFAWESGQVIRDVDGNEYTQIAPQLQRNLLNPVCGLCDIVGRLMIKNEQRFYLLEAKGNIYAKNQLDDREFATQDEIIFTSTTADTSNTTSVSTEF